MTMIGGEAEGAEIAEIAIEIGIDVGERSRRSLRSKASPTNPVRTTGPTELSQLFRASRWRNFHGGRRRLPNMKTPTPVLERSRKSLRRLLAASTRSKSLQHDTAPLNPDRPRRRSLQLRHPNARPFLASPAWAVRNLRPAKTWKKTTTPVLRAPESPIVQTTILLLTVHPAGAAHVAVEVGRLLQRPKNRSIVPLGRRRERFR